MRLSPKICAKKIKALLLSLEPVSSSLARSKISSSSKYSFMSFSMLKISQFKIFLSVLNSPKLRTKIGLCEIFLSSKSLSSRKFCTLFL